MKSFLQRIWGFVLWFISPIVIIFRGRKVVSLPEDEADSSRPDSEPAVYETWLGVVRRLTVLADKSEIRLALTLPGFLADHFFQNLRVIVFPRNQEIGIGYTIRTGGIGFYGGHEHIMLLAPETEWDRAFTKGRIKREEYCVTGIDRVKLAIENEEKTFFLEEKSGFFVPAERRAA